ncbi:MAG: DUF421 domain-containing protein [Fimbriiglobus sp.]|jgi:uncharacterized membrane protein YcaP (DUF421 family)|nr:DUF421 domain-containing protein [Fimbriiglobus sp.]
MDGFRWPDWGGVFVPDGSLAESFLRGVLVYLCVLALFRVVLRRQGGSIGLTDVMLVVLVSECVSQSLSAETKSVPNGLAAVLALLVTNFALDWLSHRWPWLRRVLEPRPVELVRDGRPLRQNMAREQITDDELAAQLRQNGLDDVSQAKRVVLEGEGTVSVIPNDSPAEEPPDIPAATARFAEAADRLRAAVAWHESRAAAHAAKVKEARDLLARHGVTGRRKRPTPE